MVCLVRGFAARCCIGVQMTFVPCLLGIFPWLGAGFDVVSPEEEADEGDASWTALGWTKVVRLEQMSPATEHKAPNFARSLFGPRQIAERYDMGVLTSQ